MASGLPIKFSQVADLASLGIAQEAFGFQTLTVTSDRFIVVREGTQVAVVDLTAPTQPPTRFPATCDAVIMHPVERIIALRSGQQLQMFNLTTKQRVKNVEMREPVEHWHWISNNTIGIITASAVYHWSMEGAAEPALIFTRQPSLQGHQLIGYKTDAAQKWMAAVGIAQTADGRIGGSMQLYSVDRKMTQPMPAHACAFATYQSSPTAPAATLFAFVSRDADGGKLMVLEVGEPLTGFNRVTVPVQFPAELAQDFPVALHIAPKHDVIYMITKFGYIYVFHLTTGATLLQCRVSAESMFASCPHTATSGVLAVNRRGQVLAVSIDEQNFIPYIINTLSNLELARQIAVHTGLPGSEELFSAAFNRAFASGDYKAAATMAADSPGGVLRTAATIQRFAQLPSIPGQPSPLLQYFGVLLEKGVLNKLETVELAKPVLQQGRQQLLERWIQENKLAYSEEFGDLMRPVNPALALQIYYKAEVQTKVVAMFAETQQYDKLVAYCKHVKYTPDWLALITKVCSVNPPGAVTLSQLLLADPDLAATRPDISLLVDIFMQRNMVQETTLLILDALKNPTDPNTSINRPEDAKLQTKLLEANLRAGAVQVAEAILANGMFTHYDKPTIAKMCERSGLPLRALSMYDDMTDIRRVLSQLNLSTATNFDPLLAFFSRLSAEDALESLKELMRANPRGNAQAVVTVAMQYVKHISPKVVLAMLEEYQAAEAMFVYLKFVVTVSEDPDLHFKYIQTAAKVGQHKEVERMCRESNFYDAEKTKDFLKEARLPDQLPLIIVCDRFDFVEDMTKYLFKNNMSKHLEAYVTKINPVNTPLVVGALIDIDCPEDFIKSLLQAVRQLRQPVPVDELVEQLSKRNRLRLIQPYLEQQAVEGSQDVALHNALARIYIDTNNKAEKFLVENPFYDSKTVGKYCENRDPYLAFVAYKRGLCSDELIDTTNRHSLFKHQARYLVERQDPALWAKVLTEENPHRRSLIDQVVQTALPESKVPSEVSVAVRAFMAADLPNELMELLDKIVLEPGTQFYQNYDLSNLLMLTAARTKTGKLTEYIHRLEQYHAGDIANLAISGGMYEDAFEIFKKFKHNVQAQEVLIDHVKDLARAFDFATRCNEPEVWSRLAKAQLTAGNVPDAITAFIKANDSEFFSEVIYAAERAELWADLIKYLLMARKKSKIPVIETELCYAFAKANKLPELEEFITAPNTANIQQAGDRCFEQGMYEPARLLYANISNFGRLATALVRLNQFQAAVDAARKANSVRTWKEVNKSCVEAGEFRLAQACGQHIIVHGDELEEIIQLYEVRGHFEEIMSLIESGLTFENAHMAMFTEMAILFSKYKPSRLLDHLRVHHARINLQKVIRVVSANRQWKELVFLHQQDGNHDKAVLTMIQHGTACWDHKLFVEVLLASSRTDIQYDAIDYYLDNHPLQTKDLLASVASKLDHKTVVTQVTRRKHLPLIMDYLVSVQHNDVEAVNTALNQLYIESNNWEALRSSIDTYANFDHQALASQLQNHSLMEFRRIASYLWRQQGKHDLAIAVSKKDNLWKDQIDAAADSKNSDVVEALLRSFAASSPECFAATLFTCHDLVRPDVALELAWRNQKLDFVMPYLVQLLRSFSERLDSVTGKPESKSSAGGAPSASAGVAGGGAAAVAAAVPAAVTLAVPMAAAPAGYWSPGGSQYAAPVAMQYAAAPVAAPYPGIAYAAAPATYGSAPFGSF